MRRRLSVAADPTRRALRAGRRRRFGGAYRRQEGQREHRPADRDREQGRRGLDPRHRPWSPRPTPDGYTLLLGQSGPISINPAVYKNLPYDPVKDFAPITMTTAYPYILVVNAELPAKSLQEFVALAKSKPDAMNYGTTGVGAANHLMSELFNAKAGLKMTHIPYRGTALAVADLVARPAHDGVRRSDQRAAAHQVRHVARARRDQPAAFPSHARRADRRGERLSRPRGAGLAWHPGARQDAARRSCKKLNEEIVKALRIPIPRSCSSKQAMQTVGDTPAEFAAFIQKDIATWKAVAAAANVTVE